MGDGQSAPEHGTVDNVTVVGSTTQKLAEFATTNADTLDIGPILEVLQKGFLDYIGLVAYAVNHVEASGPFLSAVNALSAQGTATVPGHKSRLQPQYAALLNGTMAHSMDYDDTHIGSALHPGAPVISAALAQVETEASRGRQVSGRAFFEALAVGYEVMCRIGNSISARLHRVGFHPTGVIGAFGAAAAAGRIAGFDADQMIALFGLMGSMAGGSMQYLDNGAWNKRLHPGLAAHNALLAVELVKAGVVGATKSIEGDFGLLKAYGRADGRDVNLERGLGQVWEARNTAIKPYACCRLIHAAIDALYIHRRRSSADKDTDIEVQISQKGLLIVGNPAPNKVSPLNIVDAQFSIYYHVAVAWLYGHNDWTAYEYLGDEVVADLARRVRIVVDESIPDESLRTVVTLNGKDSVVIEHPLGEPENPISWDGVKSKFHRMVDKVYGEDKAERVSVSMKNLIDREEVASFIKSL